jgi:hypothetical protein
MIRFFIVLSLALSLGGCAEILKLDEFSEGNSSSNTGGNAGEGGQGGSAGGSGGQGGVGGVNPCPNITYDGAASLIDSNATCADIFPSSGCGTADPVSRAEFIVAVINQIPPVKLMGYEDPGSQTFTDVSASDSYFTEVEQAVWLELISVSFDFEPLNPTTNCFAQEVMNKVGDLTPVHMVVYQVEPDGQFLGANVGPIGSVSYHAWGADSNSKVDSLQVVCNLSGDYTNPEDCPVADTIIRCSLPDNSGYNTYTVTMATP